MTPGAIESVPAEEVVARRFTGARPDLVLFDGMRSEPLVAQMQAQEAARGESAVPVIVVTADALDDDRRRLLAAGADLVLAKPIDGRRLLAGARALVTRVPRPLRRILVVDDQEVGRRVQIDVLRNAFPALDVQGCQDPREGLERCVADDRPDLLLVNGAMPYMNGPAVITRLRAAEIEAGRSPLPVIIDSAGGDFIERGLAAGADLAFDIPVDSLELLMLVRALFPGAPAPVHAERGTR